MRISTPAALLAVAVSAVAVPLNAQESTPPDTSIASWEQRSEKYLAAADSLAVVELRAAATRGIELAGLGIEHADDSRVKELAARIQKDQQESIAELLAVSSQLRQNPVRGPLTQGSPDDPRAVATMAIYGRDTMPVFREADDGVYVKDTAPVYRRRAIVILPITVRLEQYQADSVEALRRHTAAIAAMKDLSGAEFDEAFLEQQVELTRWRMDHIREHIIPLVWNDELMAIADDMQVDLGIHLRRALDLQGMVS